MKPVCRLLRLTDVKSPDRRFSGGNNVTNEAFTEAIIRMTPTLFRVARGQLLIEADQQDAVQEAIRRSWEKRGSLKNERYLQTWVIRILLNV